MSESNRVNASQFDCPGPDTILYLIENCQGSQQHVDSKPQE